MSIILNRNAEVYVSNTTTDVSPGPSSADTDKVSLTKQYTLDYSINTARVNRNTINPNESRAQTVFSESAETVDFSIETYLYAGQPSNVELVHRRLGIGLAGYTGAYTSYADRAELLFTSSNIPRLLENTIWFVFPNMTYRIENAVITSADIVLDLDDIAKIVWRGSGLDLTTTQSSSPPGSFTDLSTYKSCIRHKLTDISLSIASPGGGVYTANLLSCNININNNPVFVRRNKLGTFNTYTDHYTGDRAVEGTLNFYVKPIGGVNDTADLFDFLYTNKNYLEDYTADITISVGGTSQTPRFEIIMPSVYLELPNIDFTEVLTMSIPFVALESSAGSADEVTLKYYL